VVFFERDAPYYASTRDVLSLNKGELIIYPSWDEVIARARKHVSDADVAMVTSYCPDALSASDLILNIAPDESVHFPVPASTAYSAGLSYLGTWALERQRRVEALLVKPAKALPEQKFLIGGSIYGDSFPWQLNISLISHVPAADHRSFYFSSRLALNVTRRATADNGFRKGQKYFEVGTMDGYMEAMRALSGLALNAEEEITI
jgi:spore maturation protein CgeB